MSCKSGNRFGLHPLLILCEWLWLVRHIFLHLLTCVMLLLLLFTHLSFPSCGLLDETSRHGGTDRETLKEASHCITKTERHKLLEQGGDKQKDFERSEMEDKMGVYLVLRQRSQAILQKFTWLLSTLYPCFSANVFPSEIDMAYPTMASAKASPMTSPKICTSGTLGELKLSHKQSTNKKLVITF